ncbi:MAG TPA: methylated-DNA--[protein]-cysteine S-methyltransferase [Firmicutes bacterium]|mgnify:CR=1 FL=1|nr:methylated-DNA--[protein]-cysteine S-methyltransferase [Bacillota bacterium]
MITLITIPNGAAGWVIENKRLKIFILGKDKAELKRKMKNTGIDHLDKTDIPGFTELVERYFIGKPVDFSKVPIEFSGLKSFSKKILITLQKEVGYGERISYGNLAKLAGFSILHARAVGRVVSINPIPVIIPCHRVINKSGAQGGFSLGPEWKKYLLELEQT